MGTLLTSQCPKCEKSLKIDGGLLGRHVRCPACQYRFLVENVRIPNAESPTASMEAQETHVHEPVRQQKTVSVAPPPSGPAHRQLKDEPTIGRIGRFELKSTLGQGGFGKVYLAYDSVLGRKVALKVPTFAPDEQNKIRRFIAEGKAAARLRHPNIVAVFDAGQADGVYFIASEYIEGTALSRKIAEDRPDFVQSAHWVIALARALSYAHHQGVVHRDIKPENIIIDASNEPQILDFGLAKRLDGASSAMATTDGSVLGTPAYMSPEQARGEIEAVGPASDQYSLGCVLYELITGRAPYHGTPHEVIAQVLSTDPPLPRALVPDIPGDLEAICRKAMHKDPELRYVNTSELASDLIRWLDGDEIKARPPSLVQGILKRVRRSPNVATVALLGIQSMLFLPFLFAAIWIVPLGIRLYRETQRDFPVITLASAKVAEFTAGSWFICLPLLLLVEGFLFRRNVRAKTPLVPSWLFALGLASIPYFLMVFISLGSAAVMHPGLLHVADATLAAEALWVGEPGLSGLQTRMTFVENFSKAQRAAERGGYAEAADTFNEILKANPRDAWSGYLQCIAYRAQSNRDQCVASWSRLYEQFKDTRYELPAGRIAYAYVTEPIRPELSTNVVQLATIHAQSQHKWGRRLVGAALFRDGQFKQAIDELERAIAAWQASEWDYLFLALAYEKNGDHDAAVKAYGNAERIIAEQNAKQTVPWHSRVEATILQREAAALLKVQVQHAPKGVTTAAAEALHKTPDERKRELLERYKADPASFVEIDLEINPSYFIDQPRLSKDPFEERRIVVKGRFAVRSVNRKPERGDAVLELVLAHPELNDSTTPPDWVCNVPALFEPEQVGSLEGIKPGEQVRLEGLVFQRTNSEATHALTRKKVPVVMLVLAGCRILK